MLFLEGEVIRYFWATEQRIKVARRKSGRPWIGVTADRHGARNRGSWPSFRVWREAEDEDESPFL